MEAAESEVLSEPDEECTDVAAFADGAISDVEVPPTQRSPESPMPALEAPVEKAPGWQGHAGGVPADIAVMCTTVMQHWSKEHPHILQQLVVYVLRSGLLCL